MSDFQCARLDWDEQGQPLSSEFDDVYFSRASGLEETRHVFLQHNQLAERFAQLSPGSHLVIGETGFGTGLNLLCAWQLFEQHAPNGCQLHFISTEKYPLRRDDLRRALALWPELADYSSELLNHYIAIHPGFQRLHLANGRVILTLLLGDALDSLRELDAQVDAWFLDGFAPAKNPQMWSAELFAELARLSAPDATLATFTSAGFVRRGLQEAGFSVARVKGFGHKREMLAGHYRGPAQNPHTPWYARPPQSGEQRQALVIGAGLAGCSAAASLARRGWQVTILERRDQLAGETSGNPQGMLYMKLSAHHTPLSRYILSAFGYSRRLLQQLPEGTSWSPCGLLQLAYDDKERERQAQLAKAFPADLLHPVSQAEAETLAGVALPWGGLFYPQAGWANPPSLCRQLAEHPNIRVRLGCEVSRLQRVDGQWQAWQGNDVLASAPVLLLASSAEADRLLPEAELPLKRIRGQVTCVPVTPASRALRTVVCAEGYVAPPMGDVHTLGASFRFHSENLALSPEEHQDNLRQLQETSPDLAERLCLDELDVRHLDGRAGFRCTSPDYLPLVGPLAASDSFKQTYQALARDARLQPDAPCPWLEGLYLSTAHGSRGLLSAPMAGELLAGWINQEPLPLPRAVAEACHPNRFMLRKLIRGQS